MTGHYSFKRMAVAALAAVAMFSTAQAAGNGYSVADGAVSYADSEYSKVQVTNLNPADGSSVTELYKLKCNLTGGNATYGYVLEKQVAKVYNEAGEEVTYLTLKLNPTNEELRLKEAITTPGKYTIKIPAGALHAVDQTMTPVEASANDEITLNYTVYDMQKVQATNLNIADGSSVVKLSQIKCTLTGGAVYGYLLEKQAAKVYNEADEEVAYMKLSLTPTSDVLKLSTAITTPGKYTIKFPAGCLTAADPMGKSVVGTGNDEFSLTYTVYDMQPVQVTELNPADGSSVVKLSQLKCTLTGGKEYGYLLASQAAKVYNEAGEEVTYMTLKLTATSDALKFKEAITTPGKYTINFPAGCLTASDPNLKRVVGTENAEFSLTYTVYDMQPVQVTELNPADGSSVTKLSQLKCTLTGGDVYGYLLASQAAKVYNEAGEEVTYMTLKLTATGDALKFKEAITTPGKYTINFPAGCLTASDANLQSVVGTGNQEFTLNYTVVDSPALAFVSADPADNETVAALETIATVWEGGAPQVGYGFDAEAAPVVVRDATSVEVATGTISAAEGKYVITLSEKLTSEGAYTVEIPAGALWALDAEGNRVVGNNSPEVTLHYTIDGSSVGIANAYGEAQGIRISGRHISVAGDAAIEVYDLSGVRVMNVNGNEADLTVAPGLYIVKSGNVVRRVIVK